LAANWTTISSLATAGGTLVLGIATFAAVRSANRAARIAERSFQIGLRPVLAPSRLEDAPQKVMFVDHHWMTRRGPSRSGRRRRDHLPGHDAAQRRERHGDY
jgi:hypothetical protein